MNVNIVRPASINYPFPQYRLQVSRWWFELLSLMFVQATNRLSAAWSMGIQNKRIGTAVNSRWTRESSQRTNGNRRSEERSAAIQKTEVFPPALCIVPAVSIPFDLFSPRREHENHRFTRCLLCLGIRTPAQQYDGWIGVSRHRAISRAIHCCNLAVTSQADRTVFIADQVVPLFRSVSVSRQNGLFPSRATQKY